MPLNEQRRPSAYVEVSRAFRANFDAPGAARRFVVETLDQAGVEHGIDDAKLVVTELATNSVVHARSDFTVSVCVTVEELCISVSDNSRELPKPSERSKDEGGGQGLAIVSVLADSWGTAPSGAGKRVWARLGRHGGGSADRGRRRWDGQGRTPLLWLTHGGGRDARRRQLSADPGRLPWL